MKRIIRWIADVSGVTRDIQKETYEYIGGTLIQDSYWFASPPRTRVYNALMIWGLRFRTKHSPPNVSLYRGQLDEIGDKRISEVDPIPYI